MKLTAVFLMTKRMVTSYLFRYLVLLFNHQINICAMVVSLFILLYLICLLVITQTYIYIYVLVLLVRVVVSLPYSLELG